MNVETFSNILSLQPEKYLNELYRLNEIPSSKFYNTNPDDEVTLSFLENCLRSVYKRKNTVSRKQFLTDVVDSLYLQESGKNAGNFLAWNILDSILHPFQKPLSFFADNELSGTLLLSCNGYPCAVMPSVFSLDRYGRKQADAILIQDDAGSWYQCTYNTLYTAMAKVVGDNSKLQQIFPTLITIALSDLDKKAFKDGPIKLSRLPYYKPRETQKEIVYTKSGFSQEEIQAAIQKAKSKKKETNASLFTNNPVNDDCSQDTTAPK